MTLEGIYTPAITPQRDDGSIDRDAFVAQLEYLIAAGVHGTINGGSTGEYYAQSMDERLEMATLARDVTKGRTHLMVGTVAIRLEDSVTMAEHAAKIGADSILVGSPPYAVPTERESALNALAIDRAANLPIMLYNYPGRMGINMGEAFLDRVGCSRNFCAISGKTFDTINPATREVLAQVAACGPDDVNLAVQKARDAFEDGRWSRLHPRDRKEALIKLAKLVKRNARELAVLESLDSGKTIQDCEQVDVPETANCLTWHTELIDNIYDQLAPASDNDIAMLVREPVGVVGLVLPWNVPLLMLAWKIGPVLAAGCSVIVKPAEETRLTTLRTAELAMEAGIPPGVFNLVPGTGPDMGKPIGRHMDIDAVSFTGSTETGRRFLR
jgi:hypothetical protein